LVAKEVVARGEYEKRRDLLAQLDGQIQLSEPVRRPLISPIDGDISAATFPQGQLIEEGVVLFRIVNLKEVGVTARLEEKDYQRLQPQTNAKIRFPNLPGKVYTGKLDVMPPIIDPQSRTWDVLFRVENPGELLRFGMIGRVELSAP
jgi:Cu(I)/Ag(I) efflux system membrane fusion protein